MGDIEKSTRLARLLISPPPVVYEELKAYSTEVRADPFGTASDELEAKLAARGDPLIDLAIASYGASTDQIGQLYKKSKLPPADDADASYKQGLRLAVLANETVASRGFLKRFPENVIGEAELASVLKNGDWIEAQTLVENPTVADDVLLALYHGDKVADGIDDQRRRQLVAVSGRNPRLQNREDDEFGPDLGHWDLHKAIFEMLETAPTSDGWLECLDFLLMQIDPSEVAHPDSIDAILERWTVNENGELPKPSKRREYNETGLDERTQFRCLIASLYGRSYSSTGRIHGAPDDNDVVRRCAYYGNASLDPKAINAGYEKDGETFVFAAMANDDVYLKKANRKVFEDECLTGRQSDRYKRRCAQLHNKWPSFNPRPTAEWMVERSEEEKSADPALGRQVAELSKRLSSIEKSVALLPWLIVALVLVAVWRH